MVFNDRGDGRIEWLVLVVPIGWLMRRSYDTSIVASPFTPRRFEEPLEWLAACANLSFLVLSFSEYSSSKACGVNGQRNRRTLEY